MLRKSRPNQQSLEKYGELAEAYDGRRLLFFRKALIFLPVFVSSVSPFFNIDQNEVSVSYYYQLFGSRIVFLLNAFYSDP